MELLGRHSPAPAEDIARRILVGGWWARGSPAMASSSKGEAEGGELLQLCRQRLDAFREQRGEEVFPHRSRQRTPISGSVKYRVLTRARGRCECCGAGCCLANPAPTGPGGAPHRAQEPRRHRRPQQPAGPLCFRCNAGKRDGCLPTQEVAPNSAASRPAAGCCRRTSRRCA